MTSPRPVTVQVNDQQPCCPHCGQQALMTAHLPHGWDNPDGTSTTGTIPVPLCEQCDADHPQAGALITYFHVHGQIGADTVTEFAVLAQAWVSTLAIPQVDQEQLEAEIRAWRNGDL